MAKRRTSQIQRRTRASDEALRRRVGTVRGVHWRVLALIVAAVLAVAVVAVALVVGSGGNQWRGQIEPDGGANHIPTGQTATYTSSPATSGPHWSEAGLAPANWGVYSTDAPLPEQAGLHNLEHGGVIIWYQPGKLSAAEVIALENFVRSQITTERYKVIISPWSEGDFGHPIAVVAWRWLLALDTANLDAVRGFTDAHYGRSPEPQGGPGRPSS